MPTVAASFGVIDAAIGRGRARSRAAIFCYEVLFARRAPTHPSRNASPGQALIGIVGPQS